jgi:hypothetical protein
VPSWIVARDYFGSTDVMALLMLFFLVWLMNKPNKKMIMAEDEDSVTPLLKYYEMW